MEKLKTCPFCGAEAISESDIPVEGLHAIGCGNTACPVKPFVIGKEMQEAPKKWNTRKPPVGWIPVTDRLPEEDGDYLVTMVSPGYLKGQPYTNWLCWCSDDGEWTDTDGDTIPGQEDMIIAWMPVLEPYRPEN